MRKRLLSAMAAIAICLGASTMQAQLTLPTAGWSYKIKNNFTGTTYLGGSGSGSGSVKHEDAETNAAYQVFLLEGNSTDGYKFKQTASGNYVVHSVGNKWTMAYDATTSTNLFKLTDQSDNYGIIRSTETDGIGFDNATPGSTCYSDKGSANGNQWLFIADAASFKNKMQEAIDAATTFNTTFTTASLTAAIAAAETYVASSYTVTESGVEVIEAYATLNTALSNAKTLYNAYQGLKYVIDAANASLTAGEDGYDGLLAEIGTATAVYNAKTADAATVKTTRGSLETVLLAYNVANATTANAKDVSFAITNYLVENTTGWTSDPAGAWGTTAGYEGAPDTYALENGRWHNSGRYSMSYTQQVSGLAAGIYNLKIWVKASDVSTGTVSAGGKSTSITYTGAWQDIEIDDIVMAENGSLEIDITETSTYTNSWHTLSIDNVRLTYYGNPNDNVSLAALTIGGQSVAIVAGQENYDYTLAPGKPYPTVETTAVSGNDVLQSLSENVLTLTVEAVNGTTQDYTVTFLYSDNYMYGWDANWADGVTPQDAGWLANASITWGVKQSGGDMEDAYYRASANSKDAFYAKGQKGGTVVTYAYPVVLEEGKVYRFTGKNWRRNGQSSNDASNVTFAVSSTTDAGGTILATQTINCNDAAYHDYSFDFAVTAGATYHLIRYAENTSSGMQDGSADLNITAIGDALKVTFNSNGGSEVATQYLISGATATTPIAPTKANAVFDGWYSDDEFTTTYNFDTEVTTDITLYAKWTTGGPATALNNVTNSAFNIINVAGGLEIIGAEQSIKIYSLAGQLVKQVEVTDGKSFVSLKAGMYIINGQKAVVK